MVFLECIKKASEAPQKGLLMEFNFFELDQPTNQLQVQDQRHLKKVFLQRSTSSITRPTTGTGSEAHQKGLLIEVHFFDNKTNYRYRIRGTTPKSSYGGPLLRQQFYEYKDTAACVPR
jgi:hypothetical protein